MWSYMYQISYISRKCVPFVKFRTIGDKKNQISRKLDDPGQRNLSWKKGGLAVSKATVHCEFARNKGYPNRFDCHLVISQNSASYYTSSERGKSGLSADPKILAVV